MTALIIINTTILLLLSGLHFYWACGGKRFCDEAIPTTENKTKAFRPGLFAIMVVASGLFMFAFIIAGNSGVFNCLFSRKYFYYATYPVAIIFLLRAVGDFKFVGFFKRVKGTEFAARDGKIYSPLCLLISVLSFFIIIYA